MTGCPPSEPCQPSSVSRAELTQFLPARTLVASVRQSAATLACVALLLSLTQVPWRHVHTHGHDAHHAGELAAFHAHQRSISTGPVWDTHGPDEDARSLDGLRATARGGAAWGGQATLTASPALPLPTWRPTPAPTEVSRGHDPPPRSTSIPRAPPA